MNGCEGADETMQSLAGPAGAWGMQDLPGRKDETECMTAAFAKWGL